MALGLRAYSCGGPGFDSQHPGVAHRPRNSSCRETIPLALVSPCSQVQVPMGVGVKVLCPMHKDYTCIIQMLISVLVEIWLQWSLVLPLL